MEAFRELRVEFDGTDIAASLRDGQGPALVFVHGNSASGASWCHQLRGRVGRQRAALVLDLPGHGRSGRRPTNRSERYSVRDHAAALLCAVQTTGVSDIVFVGHSLGAHVAMEALAMLAARPPGSPRVRGAFFHGAPPIRGPMDLASAFLPEPFAPLLFGGAMTARQAGALAKVIFGPHLPPPADIAADLRATDPNARLGMARSILHGEFADERVALETVGVPIAVLHAADDAFVNAAYLGGLGGRCFWRGCVQTVDGAGHSLHREQPEVYGALLEAYLDDVL